jgi:EAL domain-containing protein (putative c-di-GMP-specific phosphodiesterase class I)
VEAIRSDLEEQTREADPNGVGLSVENANISLGGADMDDKDAARALVTVMSRFSRQEGDGFTLVDLSEGLPAIMDGVRNDLRLIRNTIRSGAFSMAFQPICDLETRKIHHYEILARIDGQGGSPFKFIQSAEELGLIQRFDRVMCQKALNWLVERKKEGSFYSVAVNLSAKSITDPSFMASIEALLDEHGDLREQIMFEVTESARISDVSAANAALKRLRAAGHKVCLDDFGVGESSLQDLRQYEVDLVKIDGSYVRDALANTISSHILRAVAALSRDLKIDTVAEMIEEEAVVDFLRGCGVQYGQGYLFGKPSLGAPRFTSGDTDAPKAVVNG